MRITAAMRRWETDCGACGRVMETAAEAAHDETDPIGPERAVRRLRVILRGFCTAYGCRRLLVA